MNISCLSQQTKLPFSPRTRLVRYREERKSRSSTRIRRREVFTVRATGNTIINRWISENRQESKIPGGWNVTDVVSYTDLDTDCVTFLLPCMRYASRSIVVSINFDRIESNHTRGLSHWSFCERTPEVGGRAILGLTEVHTCVRLVLVIAYHANDRLWIVRSRLIKRTTNKIYNYD